jgi:hypothetical protein
MTAVAANARTLQLILLLTFGLMLIEWLYVRLALHDRDSHDLKETTTSIVTALGNQFIRPATSFLVAFPLYLAYQYRLFEIPTTSLLALVILFVLVDFAEYWFHRAAHRVRFMWASHSVHHSTTRFNLTAAVRLPWTGALSGAVFFFLPLTLIGFHPLALIGMLFLNLLYQFFLHTEHAPRLARMRAQHAGASPRASRFECKLPRQELRRRLHHLGSAVRHLRGSPQGRDAALRASQPPALAEPADGELPRMAQAHARHLAGARIEGAAAGAGWGAVTYPSITILGGARPGPLS